MKFAMERFEIIATPDTAQDQAYLEETFGIRSQSVVEGGCSRHHGFVIRSVKCEDEAMVDGVIVTCALRRGHDGHHYGVEFGSRVPKHWVNTTERGNEEE